MNQNNRYKKVQISKKTLTPSDKTHNMYRRDYQLQLIKKNNKNIETKIKKEGIKFAKQANILDTIEVNDTGNSLLTLKDLNKNFVNHPTTRLINPSFTHLLRRHWEASELIQMKPNNEAHYIHTPSDHQPSITKQPLRSIEKHLSKLSL